mmetsp:Transcript_39312/g.94176  ORF Transcript_39312/g.94176 Transcript_39312/m.94176 type:complete len:222 (+) Transcript_39312:149-814(+)
MLWRASSMGFDSAGGTWPGTASFFASLGGGGRAIAGTSMGHSASTAMRMSSEAQSRLSTRSALQSSSSASSFVSFAPAAFCMSISGVSLSSMESDSVDPRSCRRPRSTHQSSSWVRTKRDIMAAKVSPSTIAALALAQRLMRSSALSKEKPGCTFSRSSWTMSARFTHWSASMPCLKIPNSFCAWRLERLATASSLPRPMKAASSRSPNWPSVSARPNTPA